MSLEFSDALGDELVPFADSACPRDPPDVVLAVTRGKGRKIPRATDGHKRAPGHWTSGLVVHTTSGTVKIQRPTLIASMRDWLYAQYQTTTDRYVSWHATIDLDGSVIQSASPSWTCWHASQVNECTEGFELVQTSAGEITTPQLARFVQLTDIWTRKRGIPRIIPWRGGKPYAGLLSRTLNAYGSGRALCAIYGHRNVWFRDAKDGVLKSYRGKGDPSDLPFLALADPASVGLPGLGYMKLDLEAGEDTAMWRDIQAQLGLVADGIPGPMTRRVLAAHGRPHGQLVWRPGDDPTP